MRKSFLLLVAFVVLVSSTVQRKCDTNGCLDNTPVKFCNGQQKCKDFKIGNNALKLTCGAESVTTAFSDDKHCGSGGGGHVLWLGPHPEFGCERWVPIENNGESKVLFNEFDADSDGVNDFATFSGFLRCSTDGPSFPSGTLQIELHVKPTNWTPKVEIGCHDSKDDKANKQATNALVSTWYLYDTDPNGPNFINFLTGPHAGTFIPIKALKGLAVGLGASQKNAKFGGSTWLQFDLPSSNGSCREKDKQLFQDGDLNFNLNCQCRCCDDNPPPPPTPICGNGIVETGEDCDSLELCCKNCKFVASGTECRASLGICDIAEVCSGSNDRCPNDSFQPSTTTCATTLGVCEFKTDIKCSGTSPFCSRAPQLFLHPILSSFENYNLVAFGNVNCNTGDIEGRVLAQGDVTFGQGFSVGAETQNLAPGNDEYEYYSLVAGGKLTWGNGQVYPTGDDNVDFHPNVEEFIFSGQTPALPPHLNPFVEGDCSGATGCLDSFFTDAHNGYAGLSTALSQLTATVTALEFKFNGLFIDCKDAGAQVDQYVMELPADKLSGITWFNLKHCNLAAAWVINVVGAGDVTFSGGSWPGVAERTIFNVPGSRKITVVGTELRGNLLAPSCDLDFPTGLITGKVIVHSVLSCNQINRPKCPILKPIPCVCQLKEQCDPNSPVLVCHGAHCLRPGDEVPVPGGKNCQVDKVIEDQSDSDSCFVQCKAHVGVTRPAGDLLVAQVTGVDLRKESSPVVGTRPSSAAQHLVSVGLLVVALAALF